MAFSTPHTLSMPQFPCIKMQIFLPISEKVWSSGLNHRIKISEISNWLWYQFLLCLKQLPLPTQGVSFPWEMLNGQNSGFPVEHMCYFLSKWCFCLGKSPASPRNETTHAECKRKDSPSYSQQSFWELLSLEGHGDLLSKCLSADHPAELAWLWLSHYSPNSACGGVRLKFQNFTMRDKGLKW